MKSTIGVGAKPMIINQYQIKTKGEDKMKEKQGYKIVDIKWDTDGDKALFDSLPQEIILPEQFCIGMITWMKCQNGFLMNMDIARVDSVSRKQYRSKNG